MTNDGIKNLSVEKLLEELDYCGCDTYYLDYRNIVVAEIKSRLNENEQLKQQLENEKQLAKRISELQSDLSKVKSQIDKIKEAWIDYQMVKDDDPDFSKYINNIILGK